MRQVWCRFLSYTLFHSFFIEVKLLFAFYPVLVHIATLPLPGAVLRPSASWGSSLEVLPQAPPPTGPVWSSARPLVIPVHVRVRCSVLIYRYRSQMLKRFSWPGPHLKIRKAKIKTFVDPIPYLSWEWRGKVKTLWTERTHKTLGLVIIDFFFFF